MSKPSPRSIALLVLAFVAFVSLGLPDGVLGVAWPSVRGEFRIDVGQLGWLLLSGMVGYLTSSFVSGWLVERLGVGRLLTVSSGLILGVMATFALAPSWWAMVAAGVFAGLGAGAIDAALNAFAARRFSPAVVNWLHACYGLGATLGPTLMLSTLAAGGSWRGGYAVLAGMLAAMTLAFALTVRLWDLPGSAGDPATPVDDASPEPDGRGRLFAALRRPAVWGGVAWFFVYTGLEVTAGQWSYTLLVEERGFDPRRAGAAVSLYWACLTAGRVAFGFASAKLPPALILRLTLLGTPLCAAVFWLNVSPWLSIASLAAIGFLLAPMFPLMISLTPARVGRIDAAHAVGFQISAAALGAAILPAGVGALAQAHGLWSIGPCLVAQCVLLLVIYAVIVRARVGDAAGPATSPAPASTAPETVA